SDLRDVTQSLDAFVKLDEHAERRMTDYFSTDQIANLVVGEKLFPHVGLKLLESQREPVVFRIDVENHRIDAFAFFQYFRRMLDPARRDVRDVDQPVDALLNFDEGSEVRQIPDPARDD